MKIGILLTTSPENENTHTVIQLARAARARGHQVEIFLMADGVYNTQKKEFLELQKENVKIIVCAHNTQQRCIGETGATMGSQYDLAGIAKNADLFLTFSCEK